MDAEHFVGFFVSKDLDHAVSVLVSACSTVSGEGEYALGVVDTFGFELFLGLTNPGDFRVSVDDTWDGVVVDVATLANHVLNSSDALFLSLVGKHGSGGDIADGIDVLLFGLPGIVDVNLTALVSLKTSLFELKTTSVGVTADGDENDITFNGLFRAILSALQVNSHSLLFVVNTIKNSHVGKELESLLLEGVLEVFADFLV